MRKFSLISCTLFGLALSFGVVACDGDDGNGDGMAEASDTNNPGDGDGDPTTTGDGDGDGDPTTSGDGDGCFEAPEECLRLVECLGEILPAAQPDADAQLGADGSCWCGSEEQALSCYNTCKSQIETAVAQNPTVGVCHGRYCPLEELDPAEPYGPVVNGSCPAGQTPTQLNGIPGSYCAPKCGGLSGLCPEHNQTIAEGQCITQDERCGLVCFVDPYIYMSGTQCPCGATCQPVPGLGAGRGLCTFQ
jgi:hypothetical protein